MGRGSGEIAGTGLRGGSAAWLASSAIGPAIHFAPDGVSGLADTGDAGGGADKTADAGAADKTADAADGDKTAADMTKEKTAQKPVRPDWLPETMWDADKGFKKADFDSLVALKAETDSRAASLPATADKYEIKLPTSFKVPDGFELPQGESLINADDPRVAAAREYAHKNKLSQGEFEELLAFGANMDIAERGRMKEAVGKEREKLGGRAVERIKAVTTWLDAKLGGEQAASLHSMMFTAKQIEAFERLMQLNRGDVPGNPGAGRDAKPAEIADEDWNKMSATDRINYARKASNGK
jgi:hypothetical protein